MNATCEKKIKVQDGAQILNEECAISNVESLGNVIASGIIETSTSEAKEILVEDEFLTATSDGISVNYYIVLEYPNLEEAQNNDIGGSFSGEVTVEGSDNKPDVNILAVYLQDGEEYKTSSDIPTSGYVLNEEKSTCTNGAIPLWDYNNMGLLTINLTKSGTSCYLYYDNYTAKGYILNNKMISTRKDFSTTLIDNTKDTIYFAEDNDGITYYYAGNPTDNWVKFGGFWWRIVRINGDGTIRLIYNGTSTTTTGTGTLALTSVKYNTSYDDNMYVGYMYASGEVHGYGTNSNVKVQLESWYDSNLSQYSNFIDENNGFCGDRTPSTINSAINNLGGTGDTQTYYGAFIRLYANSTASNATPSYKCNTEDLYTLIDSTKGNKKLSKPIGLITADELAYAGGVVRTTNNQYFLYNNQTYWTMSPSNYNGYYARTFIINTNGNIEYIYDGVHLSYGVRPVINLRANVTLSGQGTTSNPYTVS